MRSAIPERPAGVSLHVLTALRGEGLVRYGAQDAMQVPLVAGESVLVPAGLEEYEIQAGPGAEAFEVVKAFVPHRIEELADSLRQRGVPDEIMHQLGGEPGYQGASGSSTA